MGHEYRAGRLMQVWSQSFHFDLHFYRLFFITHSYGILRLWGSGCISEWLKLNIYHKYFHSTKIISPKPSSEVHSHAFPTRSNLKIEAPPFQTIPLSTANTLSFHWFPRLLNELHLKIWQTAFPDPHVFEISQYVMWLLSQNPHPPGDSDKKVLLNIGLWTAQPTSAILCVSRELREELQGGGCRYVSGGPRKMVYFITSQISSTLGVGAADGYEPHSQPTSREDGEAQYQCGQLTGMVQSMGESGSRSPWAAKLEGTLHHGIPLRNR